MTIRFSSFFIISAVAFLAGLTGCDYTSSGSRPVLPKSVLPVAAPVASRNDVTDTVGSAIPVATPTDSTETIPTPPAPVTPPPVVTPPPPPPPPPPPSCVSKVCGTTPQGDMCGVQDDGCGHPLDCGACTNPSQTCGGGGIPNVCGVTVTLPPHPFPPVVATLPPVVMQPIGPMSPADVDAIDNLKIRIMVPNLKDAGAKRVEVIFCPTADFYGPDCIKVKLETATTGYFYQGNTATFYLLRENQINDDLIAVIEEGKMGDLHLSNFRYFRFHPMGSGGDNSLLIGGVELSAKPKGSSEWVSVYRNPCVNRMVGHWDGSWGGPSLTRNSDHSLRDDQAFCVYMKTAPWKDAGTDDTISIQVPLSQALDAKAKSWLLYNGNDDAGSMAVHYDQDHESKVWADLKWDNYKDFNEGHATSYGFTIFHSQGRLEDAYQLKTSGDDALDFTALEVYEFNPGDPDFLMNQKCWAKINPEDDHLGALSTDGSEGTARWPLNHYDTMDVANDSQFKVMGWDGVATAFGVLR